MFVTVLIFINGYKAVLVFWWLLILWCHFSTLCFGYAPDWCQSFGAMALPTYLNTIYKVYAEQTKLTVHNNTAKI